MKKYLFVLSIFITLFFPMYVFAYNGDVIVHITYTGECYHSATCSYLKSDIEITLEDAVERGYRKCSRCSAPRLEEDTHTVNRNKSQEFADRNSEHLYKKQNYSSTVKNPENSSWLDVVFIKLYDSVGGAGILIIILTLSWTPYALAKFVFFIIDRRKEKQHGID